jgi:hypothetical protein
MRRILTPSRPAANPQKSGEVRATFRLSLLRQPRNAGRMFRLLFLFALLLALIWVVRSFLLGRPKAGARTEAYYLRKSILSPAERSFLGVLDQVLPGHVRVLAKVRLEDLFGVRTGQMPGAWQAARNRINRRHVDFLLVRASDFAPLAGIELDDSSHGEPRIKERDLLVDGLFFNSGLPLIRHPAQRSYDPAALKAKLDEVL